MAGRLERPARGHLAAEVPYDRRRWPIAERPPLVLGLAIAFLVLLTVVLLGMATLASSGGLWADAPPASMPVTATVAEIVANPDRYEDRPLVTSSEIARVIGLRTFVVGGDAFIGGAELLVVTAAPIDPPARPSTDLLAAPSDLVLLTGVVHRFDVAAYERRAGTDLDERLLAPWTGKPALLATSVQHAARARSER